MTYKFRISLPSIKGFARVYELGGKNTLYKFSKQMISDMEFPIDQVVVFKAFDAKGDLVARYATFDLGDGSIESISIDHIVKAGIAQMTFFYDTIYKKSVIITYEGQGLLGMDTPTLIETKGPNPEEFLNGFVAFEDLPAEQRKKFENPEDDDFDDEDFDDEDEDGMDDEDGAEIYDEDEE